MKEQTNTATVLSTTTGDTIWINIWRHRLTRHEYRGRLDFKSPADAAQIARQFLADNPNYSSEYVGPMPKDEWIGPGVQKINFDKPGFI